MEIIYSERELFTQDVEAHVFDHVWDYVDTLPIEECRALSANFSRFEEDEPGHDNKAVILEASESIQKASYLIMNDLVPCSIGHMKIQDQVHIVTYVSDDMINATALTAFEVADMLHEVLEDRIYEHDQQSKGISKGILSDIEDVAKERRAKHDDENGPRFARPSESE